MKQHDAGGSRLCPTSLLPLKDVYTFCAKFPTALAATEPVTIVKSTNSEKDVGNFISGIPICSCCSSPGLTEIIYDKEQRVHTSISYASSTITALRFISYLPHAKCFIYYCHLALTVAERLVSKENYLRYKSSVNLISA